MEGNGKVGGDGNPAIFKPVVVVEILYITFSRGETFLYYVHCWRSVPSLGLDTITVQHSQGPPFPGFNIP